MSFLSSKNYKLICHLHNINFHFITLFRSRSVYFTVYTYCVSLSITFCEFFY
nr:MAG TPA: hypothetical protein [Caudoviricetes sp.]